jgi:hypothetical protein
MGAEAMCRVRVAGAEHEGKALLETDEILFRGPMKLRIPLASISSVKATGGELRVEHAGGEATFVLGASAAKWAEKIRSPRSRLDKLDVKSESVVFVVGVDDPDFHAELRDRTRSITIGRMKTGANLAFVGASRPVDLDRIAKAKAAIVPNGAIWVIHPKGKNGLKDTEIFAAAKAIGLTYTKVARFSETHTAEKLVIPKAMR